MSICRKGTIVIKESLATFMKIAITAVTIGAFIFGAMYTTTGGLANTIGSYISSNNGGE